MEALHLRSIGILKVFDVYHLSDSVSNNSYYYPLFFIFFWIPLSWLFEEAAGPYRAFGYGVDSLNAVLIFLLMKRHLPSPYWAAIASTLFLLFPGNVIALEWVAAALAWAPSLMFTLLTLILFDTWKRTNGRFLYPAILALYVIGCLNKQSFYLMAPVLLIYDLLFFPSPLGWKRMGRIHAPFFVLTACFAALQSFRHPYGFVHQVMGGGLTHPILLIRQLDFIKEWFWPFNVQHHQMKSLVMLLSALFWAFCITSRDRRLRFSAVWILILGAPAMLIHLRPIWPAIRYLYIMTPGLVFACGVLGSRHPVVGGSLSFGLLLVFIYRLVYAAHL